MTEAGLPAPAAQDDLARRFCTLPWMHAEVHGDGGVFVCCPRYTDKQAIGNFFTQDFEAIWNSPVALAFRQSILAGGFDLCSRTFCPDIAGRTLPLRTALAPEYRQIVETGQTVMARGPRAVKLVHDDSCNLACPSCREKVMVAKRDRQAELDRILRTFILPFLKDCEHLILAGDGDPFASKHYRDIMLETATTAPQMQIGLHTNGVLFDEKAWQDLRLAGRVGSVNVSIDAACEATFTITRRGGDWQRLMENMRMLADKRARGEVKHLVLLFVVQAANYREIPAFVELGEAFRADYVKFSFIEHWGRAGSLAAYRQQRVFDADHPEHAAFLKVLEDPRLGHPIAQLGELRALRDRQHAGAA